MNSQRWDRIGEIYHSALSLGPTERAAFVADACSDDSPMRQEVELLLKADKSSGDFLKTDIFERGLQILMDNSKSVETVAGSDDRRPDKLVGSVLDQRYRIEKELGQGGVGAVYLARDRKLLDKPVVVKVLLEKSLQNEWVVQKFQQEKEALARVDHPGVVGILDTGELPDGKPYLVMQYVDGSSLRDAINVRPEGMDLERAASIIEQIGEALTAVHEKRIFHRDLKPENIMLQRLANGREQVKILDFGVAKIKESLIAPSTMTGAGTAGTILYMSPEQLHGDKVTAASDIYSFAVIAFEMVTGRRPFNPDTVANLAEMQREGVRAKPRDLRPRVPEAAQAAILQGLAFDPHARPPGAGEFGDRLSRALMNEDETLRYHPTPDVEIPPTQVSVDPFRGEIGRQTDKTIATPFEPARSHTVPPALPVEPDLPGRRWPIVLGGIVVVAALGLGAYWVISKRRTLSTNAPKTTSVSSSAQRSLVYSLTVQKMRDGKPYQEPFQSSGQEIFENGYKFRLNLSSPQAGYLYVFNEGAAEKDKTEFTIIYPTPLTNKGSARLDANQPIQTNWNRFEGKTGTEHFWIVWAAAEVSELESARAEAFKSKEGAISDAVMAGKVKDFLSKHAEPKPETTKDTANRQTDVRANSELLVKLVDLEHR